MNKRTQALLFTTVFLFLLFCVNLKNSFATDTHPRLILFLNQVRGEECCDPGSINHLNSQLENLNNHNFPATFLVRFDALNDPKYTNILESHPQHEIGALLEITPSLAQAAGVEYQADVDNNWYKAQHIFLVGYSAKDRRKLIDAFMSQFHLVFGYYPKTTSSWLIDAHSLNYLSDKYQITSHQITREQWGTDSYTLYGGPPHYPYFASSNWPLIPGNSNTLIIRQTVADPLYNYADRTASHTSQPNDYLTDKNIDYFKALLTNTLNQTHNPFSIAILGLENSMDASFQEEFLAQMVWVKNFQSNSHNVTILTPVKLHDFYKTVDNSVFIVHGIDTHLPPTANSAVWVTTKNYRIRLLKFDNNMIITDLRLFSEKLTGPFTTTASATENAYLIAPFILDGSRLKSPIRLDRPILEGLSKIIQSFKQIFTKKPSAPTTKPTHLTNPSSDLEDPPVRIELPKINDGAKVDITNNSLNYQSTSGPVIIEFTPDKISFSTKGSIYLIGDESWELKAHLKDISPFNHAPQIKLSGNSLSWEDKWGLNIINENNILELTPFIKPQELSSLTISFPIFFAPEASLPPADPVRSKITIHNRRAIAGRNPVRLFIQANDQYGYPTKTKNFEVISTGDKLEKVTHQPPTKQTGPVWADIYQSTPKKITLQILIEGSLITKEKIHFVTDCAQDKKACILNPIEAISFLLTKYEESKR